ncbi:hypothetical protein [Candidatus Manganitrophus noduliformans]|uniref:Uncharacterized protein n=1 Tax=Candidatus Manganitrophus noduliformans TaxID=2606439 RepID=A0A7X6DN04_9BACT|nr:hypothetical protein [Candidatus Manganitrophus noduliformans]NKE70212.1 hypothetical protein [Candidatus Manganitrophus noduliformans]
MKITSKSKRKVLRLLRPPTATGVDEPAPPGLTIRKLIHHKRYRALRDRGTIIRVEGDHLLCISNLICFGFDLCGSDRRGCERLKDLERHYPGEEK